MTRPGKIALIAVALVLLLVAARVTATERFCDGAYPRWRIHDTYDGSGCADITPAWQGLLPWNQHDTELVCIGMCSGIPLWTPDSSP